MNYLVTSYIRYVIFRRRTSETTFVCQLQIRKSSKLLKIEDKSHLFPLEKAGTAQIYAKIEEKT